MSEETTHSILEFHGRYALSTAQWPDMRTSVWDLQIVRDGEPYLMATGTFASSDAALRYGRDLLQKRGER